MSIVFVTVPESVHTRSPVYTNYEIGRRIVAQEQRGADRAEYGKQLFRELAERLTPDFGNGFSRSNLEYMRRFVLTCPNRARDPRHRLGI